MSVPGTVNFPTSLDDVTSLFEVANNATTTVGGIVAAGDGTITVVSTALFPSTGAFSVGSEIIYYTGKTSTTFTGCARGRDGTIAASHSIGDAVSGFFTARHLAALRDAVIAIETNLTIANGVYSTFTPVLSANVGSWSIGSVVQARYCIIGKQMTVAFSFDSVTIASSPTELWFTIPASKTANLRTDMPLGVAVGGGAVISGVSAKVLSGGTTIRIYTTSGAAFVNGAAGLFHGVIVFEIQ